MSGELLDWALANVEPLEFYFKIFVCLCCGFVVGFERQLRGKIIGVRTLTLIILGSMVFTHCGILFDTLPADPTRVMAQIVSGIGFLGAGAIIVRGNFIAGITSAAIVWFSASIGMLVGIGRYEEAVAITTTCLVVLSGYDKVFSSRVYACYNDDNEEVVVNAE